MTAVDGDASSDYELVDSSPTSIVTTKMIARTGHSLVITVTQEAGLLDLGRGDFVRVTIERL